MLSVLSPRGLQAIRPGEDLTLKFILHGINIIGQDDFEDGEKRARGDIFSLAIWCSGQGFLPPAPPGAREPEHAEYFKISVDSGTSRRGRRVVNLPTGKPPIADK